MTIRGCVVNKTIAQLLVNISVGDNLIAFDASVFDTNGFHNNIINNSRITIPAAVNGQYGILTACLSITLVNTGGTNGFCYFYKNGALLGIGNAQLLRLINGNGQSTDSNWFQITSGPILLTTGDYYEFAANIADGSITINAESNFGIYVDDHQNVTQRCLAKLNADLTTVNYSTPTAVPFAGTNVYDTDSIHDPSSNNTKLIIPSSLNGKYGVVFGNIHTSLVNFSSVQSLAIRQTPSGGAATLTYNGFGGNSSVSVNGFNNGAINTQTNLVQFNTGDAYELLAYCGDTSITVINDVYSRLGLWVYG